METAPHSEWQNGKILGPGTYLSDQLSERSHVSMTALHCSEEAEIK